jgi:Domain of unknown function (DUF4279)
MTLVAETAVALRFFGDDLDPEMLTTRLGKPPSTCARRGEVIKSEKTGRERAAKTGKWILAVERCEPGDLDKQIRDIFSGMTNDMMVWRDLVQKYRPDLYVGLFMRELSEGIEVSVESLSLLADRGIFLGLEIYGGRPARREPTGASNP